MKTGDRRQVPIFPLPNVVLFPGVCLPLHIFEPRYRDMTRDTLASDRIIGMVLLRDGWANDLEGNPPVYDVGCSGLITHSERLPDGRYNIVLRGIEKFRILDEDHLCGRGSAGMVPILQRDGPVERCRALIDLLEMQSFSTAQTFTAGEIQ